MKLVVGLGNPGKKYRDTRHNVGSQIVTALASALGLDFEFKKKFLAEIVRNNKVVIAKPITFMNESGLAIRKLLTAYVPTGHLPQGDNLKLTNLLVVHDEIDLPFGKVRLSKSSSSAGHKGVKSAIKALGQNFARLRIGIENRKQHRIPATEKYVLQNFTKEEKKQLQDKIITQALEEIKRFVNS